MTGKYLVQESSDELEKLARRWEKHRVSNFKHLKFQRVIEGLQMNIYAARVFIFESQIGNSMHIRFLKAVFIKSL